MSSSSVYLLLMLFATAYAFPEDRVEAMFCASYFHQNQNTVCKVDFDKGDTLDNVEWPWKIKMASAGTVVALIEACCKKPCTLEEIMGYCLNLS